MTANTIGKLFQLTSFGESHGKAIGCVIDGIPAGLELSESDLQKDLDRRKPGQSAVTTQRKEEDKAIILSGVFEGKTTGTPIAVIIENKNFDSSKYETIKDCFRPGQADYGYFSKFGFRDYRGGGRASGRETIARVIAGTIAKKILKTKGIYIIGHCLEIAGIKATSFDEKQIEKNPVRCADITAAKKMEQAILQAKGNGNSVGGIIEIIARNVPAGLGEPVFGKLDAEIAKALMSIGAVKGIEIGSGFEAAKKTGKENNDELRAEKGKIVFLSNNSGGILGGISTGQDIVVRVAVKPTPSIAIEQQTCNEKKENKKIKIEGMHDPCICPRIVPVAESMLAIVLADVLMQQQAKKI